MRTTTPEGRRPALDRLEGAWNEALGGDTRRGRGCRGAWGRKDHRGRRAGPPGPRRRRVVLYGRCVEQTLVPYQPWAEALEALLDDLPPDEAEHWLAAPRRRAGQAAPGPRP